MRTGRQESTRVRYAIAATLVFTVGVALRYAPRHWTPFPYNPDGFRFAAQAERAAASGHLALDGIASHGYGFPVLLSHLQLITDIPSLSLAQPTIALVGTIPCLLAFSFGCRSARALGWSPTRRLTVGTLAGLVLAIEGVYLRRTAAVSYEVLGILLVFTVALAFHRWLDTSRLRWAVVLGLGLLILPVTHHLSTMIAALTLTALFVVHVHRSPTPPVFVRALPVVGLFWLYFSVYYIQTRPPYFGNLATKPGLFVAWVVTMCGLALFFRRASTRARRLLFALPLLPGFVIMAVNTMIPVFPGSASTHPRLLIHVMPLVVLLGAAIWGTPVVFDEGRSGFVVLAALVGPLAFAWFGLTAGLSPAYRDIAIRAQTFFHLSVAVTAAVGIVELSRRVRPEYRLSARTALSSLLLVCVIVSMPFAFLGPPVLSYESTTTTGQFQSVTFTETHLDSSWTSDDHLTRISEEYYNSNAAPGPTYEWLQGAAPPECSVLVQESWSTVGAQAYPADPILANASALEQYTTSRTVVYAGGPAERYELVRPDGQPEGCTE